MKKVSNGGRLIAKAKKAQAKGNVKKVNRLEKKYWKSHKCSN